MLVFSISSFRKPLSKAPAYLSAVTENFACPYALETATGPTSDRTASAARVCRVRCGVGTFFSAAFYCAAPMLLRLPRKRCGPQHALPYGRIFRLSQNTKALFTQKARPRPWMADGGRRICNAGRIPLWEKWRIGPAEHAAGVFFYGWVTVIYPYLGRSSFQRGEMISILNWPEKLMHIFFEKPVTCSPYSVSLTDAWTF